MKQQTANGRGALAARFRGAITTWLAAVAPDFDTTLSISYFGSQLAFDDDACDVQSEIAWTAP